ncbi:PH domain-containing protein [Pseudohyphozyma bogoriensis]|nr:PH domain-containing protein [Pseudohyphozyma bogoriensis]
MDDRIAAQRPTYPPTHERTPTPVGAHTTANTTAPDGTDNTATSQPLHTPFIVRISIATLILLPFLSTLLLLDPKVLSEFVIGYRALVAVVTHLVALAAVVWYENDKAKTRYHVFTVNRGFAGVGWCLDLVTVIYYGWANNDLDEFSPFISALLIAFILLQGIYGFGLFWPSPVEGAAEGAVRLEERLQAAGMMARSVGDGIGGALSGGSRLCKQIFDFNYESEANGNHVGATSDHYFSTSYSNHPSLLYVLIR